MLVEFHPELAQRGTDPHPAFTNGGFRQANDVEAGQPTTSVDFYPHEVGANAFEGGGQRDGVHAGRFASAMPIVLLVILYA